MYNDPSNIPGPTPAQVDYATRIAQRLNETIPSEDISDRRALSNWIASHQGAFKSASRVYSRGPGATSRQVAYAERIARRRRVAVPDECFRDSGLMSHWINSNK
jgi:hypothetical protein